MDLEIQFDSFGSICAPVLGIFVSLGNYVELGQENSDISLILDCYKASLEVLGEGQLLVDISLTWWFSASSTTW